MKFSTEFNFGDKGWVYTDGPRQLTIGQIRIEATNSPGVYSDEDEEIQFDNYKRKEGYEEVYMCIETGIGSGSLWRLGKSIFKTREDCLEANKEEIVRRELAAAEMRKRDIEHALRRKATAEAELRSLGVEP